MIGSCYPSRYDSGVQRLEYQPLGQRHDQKMYFPGRQNKRLELQIDIEMEHVGSAKGVPILEFDDQIAKLQSEILRLQSLQEQNEDLEAQLAMLAATTGSSVPKVDDCYSPGTKIMLKIIMEVLVAVVENTLLG